jgi:GR25 family glycosyltransferase involved in LPS biosynthesis/precorrin-6B methylase 2
MKWLLVSLIICLNALSHADLTPYLKKLPETDRNKSPIKNIDFIYLINLDQRPEKLEKCLSQLQPVGIFPNRFPAIYGWGLPSEVLHGAGVQFLPGMIGDEWVAYFPPKGNGLPEIEFLREESYGKNFLCRWMTPGMVGCALSHLSVLQDAYDMGYETIWMMEDDIFIRQDPHLLSQYVEKLDSIVGKDKWDILYTDTDKCDKDIYEAGNDFESDLKGDLWFYKRPDVDLSDHSKYAKRTIINEDFIIIGSRLRAHSLILRRSGIKKILDFMKEHHIFLQYDHELAIVPTIQLFNLRSDVVTYEPFISDTTSNDLADAEAAWKKHKTAILEEVPKLLGWREPHKVEKIIEFLRETKPKTCVEIGAFGGAMTYPIASTLHFFKEGTLYAIDAWDVPTALEGLTDEKNIEWWKKVNMEAMHEQFTKLLSDKQLTGCQVIRKRSQDAVSCFSDESIDFLFIDGSTSRCGSLEDVTLYLPKVKKGGYIWLNRADMDNKNKAIAFLMKNCEWIKENSIGMECVLFQKTNSEKKLNQLKAK